MRFSQKKLIQMHDDHLKATYGKNIFLDKNFHMNYGWSESDESICTKIYRADGHECLSTYYKLGLYGFECSKL